MVKCVAKVDKLPHPWCILFRTGGQRVGDAALDGRRRQLQTVANPIRSGGRGESPAASREGDSPVGWVGLGRVPAVSRRPNLDAA